MKRFPLLLLALAVTAALVVFIGCSSDDDEPTGPTAGDPNDPQFQMVAGMIGEDFLDNDGKLLELALELIDSIPAPGKSKVHNPFKPLGTDQNFEITNLNYTYSEFWHIFELQAVLIAVDYSGETPDTTMFFYGGIDSLRFSNPAGHMRYPDLTTTTLDIRAHVDVEITGSNTSILAGNDASFVITLLGFRDYLISGESQDALSFYVTEEGDTCEASFSSTQLADAMHLEPQSFGEEDLCPTSGVIFVSASIDIACSGVSGTVEMSGTWTVNFAFDFDIVTVTYYNGTNIWTVEIPCEGAVITAYPERPGDKF